MAMSQALSEEEFHRMQVRKTTAIVLLVCRCQCGEKHLCGAASLPGAFGQSANREPLLGGSG